MKNVLVIEDDPVLTRLLELSLKKEFNIHVDFASNFLEGLAMTMEKQYDLFIVDLNLENWSGLDLIKKLSEKESIDNKIIVISASVTKENQIKGYEMGVSNFLEKPIDINILKAIMRKNLRMLDGEASKHLVYQGLSLNPGKLIADLNSGSMKATIQLSPTEYRILELLVLARGNIVNKNEMSLAGRDQNKELSHSTVEVHISSLRKKLIKVSGFSVVSKWGVGYYLEYKEYQNVA